ncbi:MAG: DNA polymerase III subunit gamma/tau [Nitrospirae bacterium]|nr:DNA polymerase III subunit gamma/tau [Nitrospirota bacterium]
MDYQVSARKYRPGTFEDVIGQPHIVQMLVNAITTKRIAHAFLFSGTRGVGKTTVARILAKALNCEKGPTGTPCDTCANCQEIAQGASVDVVEIDGASNTGVDDVREIRENVKFTPFRGSYRVYIIDEVHMLSNSAFNALLKTLEEPPPHVVFVFATTEIHKIPATILSRCQHYNFRRITKAEIIQRLRHVADQEDITVEDRSLASIARAGEGSMRDALSLLDQAVAFGGKTVKQGDLEMLLGAVPQEHVRAMIAAIMAQDSPAALRVVAQLLDQGHDLRAYCADLVEHVRNLLVASVVPTRQNAQDLQKIMDLSVEDISQIVADAQAFSTEQLQELFRIFSQAEDSLRLSAHPRFVLEVAAVRATRLLLAPAPASSVPGATSAPIPPPAGSRTTTAPQPRAGQPGAQPPQPTPRQPVEKTAPQTSRPAPQAAQPGTRSQPPVQKPSAPPTKPQGEQPSPARPTGTAQTNPATKPTAATPARPAEAPRSAAAVSTPPIQLHWEALLERVESRHPNIAPYLAQGTLAGIEGNQITLGYPKTASIALSRMMKDETRTVIEGICSELAGRPVRLRVVELTDERTAGPSMAQSRAMKERDQKQALMERTRAHPLVKQALEVFGGELVEVRQVAPQKETEK